MSAPYKHSLPGEKAATEHVEVARHDSGPSQHKVPAEGVYGEAQQHDPKWEKATVRKIDVRLLIICTCPRCSFPPRRSARRRRWALGESESGPGEGDRRRGRQPTGARGSDGAVGLCYTISLIDRTNISVSALLALFIRTPGARAPFTIVS